MGLYDSYQLANSRDVQQYQGSTMPEMIKVADVLQQRYDASELGMEGLGTMIKGAKVLGKDQELFNQRSGEYTNQLQDWSKRADLENITKDVAKAGRSFGNEYKQFADNLGRAQAYQKELDDQVEKKYISRETANKLLEMSHDQYSGMKYDPSTGKYTGQFSGQGAAREVDKTEWVKKVAGDIAASKGGTLVESPSGDYFIKRGSTHEAITLNQIKSAMQAARDLDPELNADLNQRAMLAGWNAAKNYKLEDFKGTSYEPKIKAYIDKGYKPAQAIAAVAGKDELEKADTDLMKLASKYAYDRNTTSFEYDGLTMDGERKKKKLDDEDTPLVATILQPYKPIDSSDPKELDQAITGKADARNGVVHNLNQWIRDNGVTTKGGRQYDKDGNDVTFTYQKHQDLVAQADKAKQSLETLKKDAMAKADFKITPALEKKAREAYDKAYWGAGTGQGAVAEGGRSEAQKKKIAQDAYDEVIGNTPGYKRYKNVLQELSKGQAMQVGITTFDSKATNKAAEEGFKNLALNLDTDGLQFGALGLQWGTGDDANKPLEADDYAKIKEDAKFVGVGIDVDGKYKFWYKVGNVQGVKQKGGEEGSVMVKMPAMAGSSEALIKSGQITMAEQVLTQNMADILSTPSGKGTMDLGKGKVRISRVGDALTPNSADAKIMLEYEGNNGKWIQVPVNSRGEAVSSLIKTLSAH